MTTYEGTFEIPLDEFWEWVAKRQPSAGHEYLFGVPRVNKTNQTLEIDFAASSESSPADWVEKPKAFKQWDELQ